MNLIIYISIKFNKNLFEIFNKILFYFSLLIIFEFIFIKVIFILNYNNLIFPQNFYKLFLSTNPIVYYDRFFTEGRIFRSLFINDHLITSFILFMGFLSNLFIYEKNKNNNIYFFWIYLFNIIFL